MSETKVTRRGVYKDLTKSPHVFNSPCGDSFKFASAKKLEIYTRDVQKEIEKLDKALARHGLRDALPPEIVTMLHRYMYRVFYHAEG